MRFEDFKVSPIRNLDFSEKCDDMTELIPVSSEVDINDMGDILRRHHSIIRAGIGEYKIYGIIADVDLTSEEDSKTVTSSMKGFFTSIFEERNILSLKFHKNKESNLFNFKILIYPQTIRMLTPEKWFNILSDNKIFKFKNEVLTQLKTYFEDVLNDKVGFAERVGYEDSSVQKVANIDLIKDMVIEDLDPENYEEKIYDAYGLSKQEERDMPFSAYTELVRQTTTYFTIGVERGTFLKVQSQQITEKEFMSEVEAFVKRTKPNITDGDLSAVLQEVSVAVFGNYILEPLLNATDISDIKVLGPKKIRVKCNGKRMTSNVTFYDDADYYRFFNSLAVKYNFNWNDHAIILRTDSDSNKDFILRVNITTPEINSTHYPYLHIRKIRKKKMTMEELIKLNCVPRHVANYLIDKINTSSMVFCGKGGSGKTTFMNTLIDYISWGCSGACYQESEELFSYSHPDFMWQHYVPAGNGYEGYSLKDEARNGLRTDLDYLIIGEITGGEARDFLTAITTGHRGMCSVHSYDTVSAADRLVEYIMRESSDYSKAQAMYMLKEIGCIVYMENFKVKEISEIEGYDKENGVLVFKTIYRL